MRVVLVPYFWALSMTSLNLYVDCFLFLCVDNQHVPYVPSLSFRHDRHWISGLFGCKREVHTWVTCIRSKCMLGLCLLTVAQVQGKNRWDWGWVGLSSYTKLDLREWIICPARTAVCSLFCTRRLSHDLGSYARAALPMALEMGGLTHNQSNPIFICIK